MSPRYNDQKLDGSSGKDKNMVCCSQSPETVAEAGRMGAGESRDSLEYRIKAVSFCFLGDRENDTTRPLLFVTYPAGRPELTGFGVGVAQRGALGGALSGTEQALSNAGGAIIRP